MSSIWDLNLKEFRDRIASADPTPGGGSVAAVTATEGLALVLMALEVSAKRKDAGENLPKIEELTRRGTLLLALLSGHADKDIEAFENYMTALHLPKSSPEEEEKRKGAVAEAGERALKAPLASAEDCVNALMLAREAVEVVHAGIVSDVGAGAALLHGALIATLYNVDINLKGMPEGGGKKSALATKGDLMDRGGGFAHEVAERTLAKILG